MIKTDSIHQGHSLIFRFHVLYNTFVVNYTVHVSIVTWSLCIDVTTSVMLLMLHTNNNLNPFEHIPIITIYY